MASSVCGPSPSNTFKPLGPTLQFPNKSAMSLRSKTGFNENQYQCTSRDNTSYFQALLNDDLLQLMKETEMMETKNDIDEWIKANRMRALQQIKDSSSCINDSSEKLSHCKIQGSSVQPTVILPSQSSCRQSDGKDKVDSSIRNEIQRSLSARSFPLQNAEPNDMACSGCQNFQESHDRASANIKSLYNVPSYDASSLMALNSRTGFFDSHCHLDFLCNRDGFRGSFAEYLSMHKDSMPKSYKGCIAVFCKPWTFAKKRLWEDHLKVQNVWAAFGCHPKNANKYNEEVERALKAALYHPKVKALGEIGLDYSERNTSPKEKQHAVFKRQLKIACERNLPVVIHCRDADVDTIEIMQGIWPRTARFHLHCFTGDWRMAQRWIKAFPNVFIGMTNLVTFPSAEASHEVAKNIPLSRLLLETDAPYFVPRILKGEKSSHPGMAIHVAAQIAAFKNVPIEDVLRCTEKNTRIVYNL